MGERVTLSELARRLAYNRSYIHKLKTQGVLAFDEAGLIDEDHAREAIAANSDPAKAYMHEVNEAQRERFRNGEARQMNSLDSDSPRGGNRGIDFARVKTMHQAFLAKLAELDFKERKGELVSAAAIEKAIIDAAAEIRASLERIPDRLALLAAAESDPEKCHALLSTEIEEVLNELTALCERMARKMQPG